MKRLFCFAVLLSLISAAFAETEIRRAGAHVHSVAAAQLALEDGRVDLMVQIPGANLVGFEHPPRDDQQAELLASARERLTAGDWLTFPDGAGCTTDVAIELPGFAGGGNDHGHDHEHDPADDHAHGHEQEGHEHDGHDHAEFHLTVAADCKRAPDWLEVRLFEGWPDNRSIQLDVISATRQWRAELTAEQTRVALQ